MKSKAAEQIQLLVQLEDEHGVVLEGVRLRLTAWADQPMVDIVAIFEILSSERWMCASRVDFVPQAPHSNKHWRKLRLPADVNGSHIHSFEDNAKLGRLAFTASENLPAARPLGEEPNSLRDIFRVVGEAFKIEKLNALPMPEWNGSLL